MLTSEEDAKGARVQPLVRELDPTCTTESSHAATKDPVCHNYNWEQPNKHIIFKKKKKGMHIIKFNISFSGKQG